VIRAVALDHGDAFGTEPTGHVDRRFQRVEDAVRVVRAPEIYRSVSGPPCFALQLGPAACLNFTGSSHNADVVTYATHQPPAYYVAVGVVSWMFPPGPITVYVMRFLGALMAGAFIATAIVVLRQPAAPRLLAAGLLLAITPMVLFTSSVITPSASEIGAALAFWACGLALLSRAHERIDTWLVTAAGIAGCVLALSRQLGPLWLALIVLAVVAVSSRAGLRKLGRSNRVRLWATLVLIASGTQIAWDVFAGARTPTLVNRRYVGLAVIEPLNETGHGFRWYREMIGWFGWLDTQAPALTWLLWTAAIGFVVLVALVWANRRRVAVLLGLLAALVVIPVVVDSTLFSGAASYGQGRDILPLAVGIPIVAAFVIASTGRLRDLARSRFIFTIGMLVGVAQFLAFAQNLRRYTVGFDGPIIFWQNVSWVPPIPPSLLTVAYGIVLTAFLAFVLIGPPSPVRPHEPRRETMTQAPPSRRRAGPVRKGAATNGVSE
jgi:hypothetical protein